MSTSHPVIPASSKKVEPSWICPRCGMTSYNRNDPDQGFCGHCHLSLDDSAAAQRSEFIYLRDLADGRFVAVEPTIWSGSNVKLCSNYESDNFRQYKDAGFAHDAATTWDPLAIDEPYSWYRHPHTSRRRPYGNPKNEYVRP